MIPTLHDLRLDSLSPSDRLILAQTLWDSIHDEIEQTPIPAELRDELIRRAAAADVDPSAGTDWDAVREAARKRWQR